MHHLNDSDFLIAVLFALCGFFITFFLRKMFNLFLLTLLLFAAFTALEAIRVIPAWAELQRLTDLTSSFGKTVMALIRTTITKGTVLSLMLFCMGGVAGLVTRQRG